MKYTAKAEDHMHYKLPLKAEPDGTKNNATVVIASISLPFKEKMQVKKTAKKMVGPAKQ